MKDSFASSKEEMLATISERLIALKNKKGVLQKHIARETKIPLRTYQRYENGTREPSVMALISLSRFFGVSTDYLLGVSQNEVK